MKNLWNKIISVCMAAAMVFGLSAVVPVSAEEVSSDKLDMSGISVETEEASSAAVSSEEYWPSGPDVLADCAVLMDATTGAILYAKNPDQQMYPASITKIMTCLLALENCSLDETVVFSYDAVYKNETDSSHIARDVDEEMTMEETLYAVMLESANECAYAVAEHVGGGDYQTFIDMMNERAAELGCTNTHFNNANGLPDESHVTTARDMALISREALKNSEFRKIVGTTFYTIPPTNKHDENTYLNNHNKMINNYKGSEHLYEYCIGGKTGYTEAAGNTFVGFAEKDDKLLIGVVLRSSSMYDDCEAMFEYGFNNFSMYNISQNETRYGEAAEAAGSAIFDSGTAFVELDPDAEVILPDGVSFNDTSVEISYDNASEDILGTLVYSYDGRTVGSADIIITGTSGLTYDFGEGSEEEEDAEELAEVSEITAESSGAPAAENAENVVVSERRTLTSGMKLAIVILIILVAVLIILLVATRKSRRRRRRKRKKRNGSGGHGSSGGRSGSGGYSSSGGRSGSGGYSSSGGRSGSSGRNNTNSRNYYR